MASIIQMRRDLAANWTSENPTLASGELGIETDTSKIKVGDGVTAWTSLSYWTLGTAVEIVNDTTPQLGGNLDINGFDIPGFATDAEVALKAALASPTFTGTPAAPTAATTTNTTQLATTAFVQQELTAYVPDIVDDTTPQLGGDLDSNGNQVLKPSSVQDSDVTVSTTSTHTFDYADGVIQQVTASGSITMTLATTNFVTGAVCGMIIDAVNWGSITAVTHPAAWLFAAGTVPTYTAAGTDRLLLLKDKDDIYTLHIVDQDIKTV